VLESFHDLDLGIGVNVHYVPVHLNPYYRKRLGTAEGLCPVAEAAFNQILSLPMYPGLTPSEQKKVIETLRHAVDPTSI
jgi:perosamine synthetase